MLLKWSMVSYIKTTVGDTSVFSFWWMGSFFLGLCLPIWAFCLLYMGFCLWLVDVLRLPILPLYQIHFWGRINLRLLSFFNDVSDSFSTKRTFEIWICGHWAPSSIFYLFARLTLGSKGPDLSEKHERLLDSGDPIINILHLDESQPAPYKHSLHQSGWFSVV